MGRILRAILEYLSLMLVFFVSALEEVHCVSGGNFRPPNGSVVAHQVGDVNITFECDIYDDNGNQTFTQWSIKNLRGVPGLKSVPLTLNNTLIEGDVGICPVLTTCRNRLIFPEFLANFDGATLVCGTAINDMFTVGQFSLRMYRPPQLIDGLRMAVEGTTVLISIDTRFEAFPFPRDIQWTKDGMAVNNSSMITFGYPSIRFQWISREDSGNYILRATNYRIDDPNVEVGTALGRIKLDILFAPEITTSFTFKRIHVNGTLTASCDFVGVPAPNITWTHNSTMDLNERDSSVSIITKSDRSVLRISNLSRDDGGLYSCTASNFLGSQTNITNVFILVPPAPVSDLTSEEHSIEILWRNGFDGFSPITGARIEYFVDGIRDTVIVENILGSNPRSYTLTSLNPFTSYTITVFLENEVGRSDPMSIIKDTLSLILEPPTNVMLTSLSSTELELTWNPPIAMSTTDFWTVMFSLREGGSDREVTTRVIFGNLLKGTEYWARVAGTNVRGIGIYSPYVNNQTNVDSPSEPIDIVVDGISSFALNVDWRPPVDNGGRPVQQYRLSILNLSDLIINPVGAGFTNLQIRSDSLMENTVYSVSVTAENEEGTGNSAIGTGTTLPLSDPQPILDNLMISNVLINSAVVSWAHPGGNVTEFIIVYVELISNSEFNVTVDGALTMFTLTGLSSSTIYSVVIFTQNNNGISRISSPLIRFNTESRTPDSTNNTVLIVTVVVTVIVIFPLGLVLGLLLKWYLSRRNELKSSDQQMNPPSSGPVYEAISPPTNTIELETNEAYGHVIQLKTN